VRRLTPDQLSKAISESSFIDASPHEWPTVDMIPLLCNAVLDLAGENDRLRKKVKE
jgi:hypothetical protein